MARHNLVFTACLILLPFPATAIPLQTSVASRAESLKSAREWVASPIHQLQQRVPPPVQAGGLPVGAIVGPILGATLLLATIIALWQIKRRLKPQPQPTFSRPRLGRNVSDASVAQADGFRTIRQPSGSRPGHETPSVRSPLRTRIWRWIVPSSRVHPPAQHTSAPVEAPSEHRPPAAQPSRRRQWRGDHRRLRRTDSGQSIRTVPEYATEVHPGEVLLFKAENDSLVSTDDLNGEQQTQQTDGGLNISASIRNSFRRSIRRTFGGALSRPATPQPRLQEIQGEEQEMQEAVTPPVESDTRMTSEGPSFGAEAYYIPDYESLYPSQIDLGLPEGEGLAPDSPPGVGLGLQGSSRSLASRTSQADCSATRISLDYEYDIDPSIISAIPPSADLEISTATSSSRRWDSQSSDSLQTSLLPSPHTPHSSDSSSDLRVTQGGTILPSQASSSSGAQNIGTRPRPSREILVHLGSLGQLNAEQMKFMSSAESLGKYGITFASNTNSSTPRGSLQYPPAGSQSSAIDGISSASPLEPTENLTEPPPPDYGGAAFALPAGLMSSDTPLPASIVPRRSQSAAMEMERSGREESSRSVSNTGFPTREMVTGARSSMTLPKSLRTFQNALLSLYNDLREEQALLERLWYKSHAQFRSVKWFRNIDGLRRCLRRIVGRQEGYQRRNVSKKTKRPTRSDEHAKLIDVLRGNTELYSSLFDMPRPTTLSALMTLPKMSVPLTGTPTTLEKLENLLELIRALFLLSSLQARSRSSFLLLRSHLNTPPAPTFAPLTTVLLAISSRIESICDTALFGRERAERLEIGSNDGRSSGVGLVEWYERERELFDPSASSGCANLQSCSLDIDRCPLVLQQLLNSNDDENDHIAHDGDDDADKLQQRRILSNLPLKLLRPSGNKLSEQKVDAEKRRKKRKKSGGSMSGQGDRQSPELQRTVDADGLPPVPKKRKGLWEELSLEASRSAGGGMVDDGEDDLGVKV